MILLPTLALFACGKQQLLSADPVDATLVDGTTGHPMADVPVVAYWGLKGGSLAGDSLPCGTAGVEEAVTDKDGKFHIPGWGPIKTPCGYMPSWTPEIFAFKSGYSPLIFMNTPSGSTPSISHSVSEFNGMTIKMWKDPDQDLRNVGPNSYSARFSEFNWSIEDFTLHLPGQCNWIKIPNMVRALGKQQRLFDVAGAPLGSIASDLVNADKALLRDVPECGSAKKFVEGLGI